MDRTVRLRLKPTPEEREALLETIRQFTESFNAICRIGWEKREGNAYTLHHLTYRDGRNTLPRLASDLHIQARQKASEAVKSAITRAKKGGRASCPQSAICPPRYNLHTFKVYWDKGIVSLATTRGRAKIPFRLPDYARYALGCPTATADLIYRKGEFYLHVIVKLPAVPFIDNGTALGVDLGIIRPAVTSDNQFLGKRAWKEVVNRTFRLRRALQANGSKSAKRHLRRLAGREQRFRRDCDHVLSASILRGIEPGTTIAIENLTNLRTQARRHQGEERRRLHSWSFAQLTTFLDRKAEAIGCRVAPVDRRQTSLRCNRCGYIYRGNRKRSEFCCRKCGFKHSADLNAAKNIRDRYLVGWATCPSDALPSTSVSSQPSVARDKPPALAVDS